MMEAMMEDLKPAVARLKAAKADVAVALGKKKDEDTMMKVTQVFELNYNMVFLCMMHVLLHVWNSRRCA